MFGFLILILVLLVFVLILIVFVLVLIILVLLLILLVLVLVVFESFHFTYSVLFVRVRFYYGTPRRCLFREVLSVYLFYCQQDLRGLGAAEHVIG